VIDAGERRVSDLGDLADPCKFTGPIDVTGVPPDRVAKFLRDMVTIRVVEEELGELVSDGTAKAPCHLGIGQEAVAVGVSACLRATDRVFGGHRSHSHYLALGGDPYRLIAEVLGKAHGASRGMGGSMHLFARDVGFHGSVPLVAATIPIAVGAALAAKMDGGGDIAVAYFGDGAAEEGAFHESLNLAVVYRLPVLFVCENNLYSSHLDIRFRQPSDRVARFADAHCVPNSTVDGNDVVAVMRATQALVDRARTGGGPGLLEAVTYRFRGHVGANEDIDVGVRRSPGELAAWKARCPLRRLAAGMQAAGLGNDADLERVTAEVRTAIRGLVARARVAAYPPASALMDFVYYPGAER
jgi:pyruvate dehydrogenase E1 component alpha subunit